MTAPRVSITQGREPRQYTSPMPPANTVRTPTRRGLIALLCLIALGVPFRAAAQAWRDTTRSIDARVTSLLTVMTREEKFWQAFMTPGDLDTPAEDWSHGVYGLQVRMPAGTTRRTAARAHAARLDSIQQYFVTRTRLGIPMIPFEEALHGLVADGATVFPQAIGLAATWDTALVERVHGAAARETRSRGIRHILSPVVNLATDVRWGRTEETLGEDVLLSSAMGRAHVRAFERMGIIATPKHFVANVGDGGRDSYPIDVSRRALEERFFPPFRAAIRDAGARSVMTAYNAVDGVPATQSSLLMREVLRDDWKFTGVIISDASATGGPTVLQRTEASMATATEHAFRSGLDVVFETSWAGHKPYWDAVRQGLVADAMLDSAVTHVLRAKFSLGLFENSRIDPDSAAFWNGRTTHRVLARESAEASLVLLQNDSTSVRAGGRRLLRPTLPLAPNLARLAVIGVDAAEARLGGYSGTGIAPVSILDGIRARAGTSTAVQYVAGPGRAAVSHVAIPETAFTHMHTGQRAPGLHAEYWDNIALGGEPRVTRTDAKVDFGWTLYGPAPELEYEWYSGRWVGSIDVPRGGATRIGIEGNDGYRLWIDGVLRIDRWYKRSFGVHLAAMPLSVGRHDVKLEYFEATGNARLRLVWTAGVRDAHVMQIAQAAAAARASDAAVVVVGIEEGEFRDRASLRLPGHQETLVRAIAATGTPTTVVIIGGSAVTMSQWVDSVGAVLHAWYPGEEGGHAVARVLFGDASPSGRLPITFPVAEGQLPLVYDHKPTGRGDDYVDLTGHPLFPFGHGLSYTTFAYDSLSVVARENVVRAGDSTPVEIRIRARIRNTGTRAGHEVVQLYVRDVLTSVAQPLIALKGFTRVWLEPGQSTEVTFTLGTQALQLLNEQMQWVVEPGEFAVMVGASSRDIRLRGRFRVE